MSSSLYGSPFPSKWARASALETSVRSNRLSWRASSVIFFSMAGKSSLDSVGWLVSDRSTS